VSYLLSMFDDSRPFKILGIQQIAIGAEDKAELEHLFCNLLGLKKSGNFRSEKENVDETLCSLGSGDARVQIDLMQSLYLVVQPIPF